MSMPFNKTKTETFRSKQRKILKSRFSKLNTPSTKNNENRLNISQTGLNNVDVPSRPNMK